jgi:hypothetical protein
VTEIESFMGLTEYYCRFILGFAAIAQPWHFTASQLRNCGYQKYGCSSASFMAITNATRCNDIVCF